MVSPFLQVVQHSDNVARHATICAVLQRNGRDEGRSRAGSYWVQSSCTSSPSPLSNLPWNGGDRRFRRGVWRVILCPTCVSGSDIQSGSLLDSRRGSSSTAGRGTGQVSQPHSPQDGSEVEH